MRIRTLSIANLTLGLLLGALTFIAPPRFWAAACASNADCSVTQLDRLQFGSVPVLAFAVFVGIALLLSRLSGMAARLLLATPLVIGFASMLGLFGVAIFASLQA